VTDLLQRVEENILNHRLLKRGQAVLVAVSGGLDSMTLLHTLHELSSRHQWKLTVAHFNHQLRGRSSDADEKLVRQTAAAMRLPFVAGRANVKEFAQKSKLSIEMAARKLRHDFFARTALERKIRVVALAHHADDQVELFFLRVLRGVGGEGLAGMKWRSPSPVDSKTMLVRPLLDATKVGLRGFVCERKIHYRDDATNATLDMPRNRVRNELLPLLQRRYQPALAKTILRLMEIVGAEAEAIGGVARQWVEIGCKSRGDEALGKSGKRKAESGKLETPHVISHSFASLPVAVQRRVLQLQLTEFGVAPDFELIEQLRVSPGKFVSVGSSVSVARDAGGKLDRKKHVASGFNANETAVNLVGSAGDVEFDGVHLGWRLEAGTNCVRPHGRKTREFFDADKVGGKITLRHWRPGDRLQPIGLKSPVKLQDLFTNRKIPRARRRKLMLAVAENREIFWVEGLRISENFKLTPQTRRRLVWRWRRPAGV
jgi:tRNA(Ile)-lysidine synthase